MAIGLAKILNGPDKRLMEVDEVNMINEGMDDEVGMKNSLYAYREHKREKYQIEQTQEDNTTKFKQLFRPPMRLATWLLCVLWFITSFTFYGLNLIIP